MIAADAMITAHAMITADALPAIAMIAIDQSPRHRATRSLACRPPIEP